jgi:hypothetical protein
MLLHFPIKLVKVFIVQNLEVHLFVDEESISKLLVMNRDFEVHARKEMKLLNNQKVLVLGYFGLIKLNILRF